MILVSDGVSSMLSDDEVVDLARDARDPKSAADKILAFAEELGGDDNATAIVVPLAGWGLIRGPDKTKELREYRRQQAGSFQTSDKFIFQINGSFQQSGASASDECSNSYTIIIRISRTSETLSVIYIWSWPLHFNLSTV